MIVGLLYILADENMLRTIIRNLLSNAIKYTGENGEIIIKIEKKENLIEFTIQDSGVGMSEEQINRLWDVSKKESTEGTKGEKGSGLGLLLCKELVEQHGGHVWAESEVGYGSAFIFNIPLI